MPGFEQAWIAVASTRQGGPASPRLRPYLQAVYMHVLSEPVNLVGLKKSLEDLLHFLAGDGRTSANCWTTDLFFALNQEWERDWGEQRLPEDFHDILAMMGEALHDAVESPDIARNFGCLPEQLLERVQQLREI